MGACISSSSSSSIDKQSTSSANVITISGELRQYKIPTTTSKVLDSETSSPNSYFLCSSDRLNFEEYIPCLKPDEQLQASQIYFVLPTENLKHKLAAADMAALAVKATAAMDKINGGKRKKKARISPVMVIDNGTEMYNGYEKKIPVSVTTSGLGRSGSVKRLQRAKMAVRSFRIRLSTINEEGSVRNDLS